MTDLKNICGVQAAGEPPGASNSGYDAVTGARLGGLTNKAGMSFSFMRMMLATARSIQDSTLTMKMRVAPWSARARYRISRAPGPACWP